MNISPLKIETEEERRLFKEGEENYKAKKAMLKTALKKQTPNDEESDLIHAMWLKQLEYHGQYFHQLLANVASTELTVPQIQTFQSENRIMLSTWTPRSFIRLR